MASTSTKTTATPAVTFSALSKQLSARSDLAPLYLLHGEEGYSIDALVSLFAQFLPEEDRDFNLYTFYAPETDMDTVMDTCRRLPMMAQRQMVILKEAQSIRADSLNKLHFYAEQPVESTTLVIVSRGVKAKGKDLIAAVKKNGVIFESARARDRELPGVISDIIQRKGLSVDPKALSMLRDYLGNDMARIHNEIDKLSFILGKGAMVTPEAIERNIGISKDYNNFELVSALSRRDAAKAMTIVEYFRANPKNNPTVLSESTQLNHFNNLLIYHKTLDKSPAGYMDSLGLKGSWALREYEIS
ncbi:MAG: DNA polymerase III subunit delta, partial [Duncaniella sp.]|nr:DNA polymerase III subunit delta [Duncaniella sp.]